jgi:hypothetical protein
MNENIPAFIFIDKAIPLFVIEPFYCPVRQNTDLLFSVVLLENIPPPLQTILRHIEEYRSEIVRSGGGYGEDIIQLSP